MHGKNIVLLLITSLVFGAAAQHSAVSAPNNSLTGTILSGGCLGGNPTLGVPSVVFLLGQYGNVECTYETGAPVRGVPMPTAGTLANLRVVDDPSNQGSVVTVYVNGKSIALSCTEGTSGTCSDITHKIAVKAGDQVAATYTSSTGALSNAGFVMSLEKLGG
jgi:hypothetical protein